MAWWSYSFVFTSCYLIMTYLKVLNFENVCQTHSVSSVKVLNFENVCQTHSVSSVYLRLSHFFSIIFHAIYEAVCIQLTHFCYDYCENGCTLSYYHHQIVSIIYLPLFMVRSWKNGLRCVSLYILMLMSFTEVTRNISLFSPHLFVTVSYIFQEINDIVWNKWNSPLPWASVHWLVQCTLECHWNATGDPVYTGTPLEKLSWNNPTLECHWRN